ncbi:MAG: hypothetical protein HWQ41_30840 [Nostoc sp. NOS(2021)]|uniref:hypothetical protein n=1 Tax=Nostoc sp. NOS(2021) TaxID=2815407 RepID=UPI0025EB4548|nr:hypothetical protein [Nostoc sp. NOS(2021)]MBN3899506.1 hypothetical protein [Nostoc sp. NOS(2021)]
MSRLFTQEGSSIAAQKLHKKMLDFRDWLIKSGYSIDDIEKAADAYDIGVTEFMDNNLLKALDSCTEAIDILEDFVPAFLLRAMVFKQLGMDDDAIEDLFTSLLIKPDYDPARYELAQTYLQLAEKILAQTDSNWIKSNKPSQDEKWFRDKLANEIGGETESYTPNGLIDILTSSEIIEVKSGRNWKHALGQILVYSQHYPCLNKRIHLFGELPRYLSGIKQTCQIYNVEVSWEDKTETDSMNNSYANLLMQRILDARKVCMFRTPKKVKHSKD